MPSIHKIRLSEPWQTVPLAHGVRYRRTFHRPTGLEPTTQVELVLDHVRVAGDLYLNGSHLGSFTPDSPVARFRPTGSLTQLNQVEIDISSPVAEESGLSTANDRARKTVELAVGEVRLEIKEIV